MKSTKKLHTIPTNTSLQPTCAKQRRRSRSRASASPGRGPLHKGLMNAAWPRTSKYRPILASGQTCQSPDQIPVETEKISSLINQIEDMEVDTHESSVLLSCGAAAELNALRNKAGSNISHASTNTKSCCQSLGLSAQSLEPKQLTTEVETFKKTPQIEKRKSEPVGVETSLASCATAPEASKTDTDVEVEKDSKKSSTTGQSVSSNMSRKQKSSAIHIVLHVNRVEHGTFSGPALCPVKISAESILIQIEDEETSKETSFKISCSSITKLEMSLEKHPYFLKFKASEIRIDNEKISALNTDQAREDYLTLHLAYKSEVPKDVLQGLEQLFRVKLANLNLWKESSPAKQDSNQDENCSPIEKRKIDTDDEKTPICLSTRKRTPAKTHDAQIEKPTVPRPVTIARRKLNMDAESKEERIRNLEHEAAHYQFLLGYKRLGIQQLEEQIRGKEAELQSARQEALREIELRDNIINNLQSQLEHLRIVVSAEKNKTEAQKKQIADLQKNIDKNNRVVEQHRQAILVRDNQLKVVRTTANSPSKMSEAELREEIRRLDTGLKQMRSVLDETRRSKNNVSDELRRNVDLLRNSREELRCGASRIRRMESELATNAQRLTDVLSAKKSLEVERNDERNRARSLERELLNYRRRLDDESNVRLELEMECRTIREEIDRNNSLVNQVTKERDDAVIEVGILKREIHNMTDQMNAEMLNSRQNLNNPNSIQNVEADSNDWIIDRAEITMQDTVLGVGGWGSVKLGRFRGTEVAVKQIHHLILSPHNRRLFRREMSIASRCRHPCLLQFIGATYDDGIPLFVSELLDNDLRSHLRQNALSLKETFSIALDVSRALNYLHKAMPLPIIHRDISSSNILLWYKRNDLHAKLSDYGAANFMRISMTRYPGASLYSAPETASRTQTSKVDIFSFGVLFCEMLIRELPVIQERAQQISLITNEEHRALVCRCIEEDPNRRPSADELIQICERWHLHASN